MSEWISVDDRLPDDRTGVLILWYDEEDKQIPREIMLEHPDCMYSVGFITGTLSGEIYATALSGGVDNHYVSLGLNRTPTHWMPLPEPPND